MDWNNHEAVDFEKPEEIIDDIVLELDAQHQLQVIAAKQTGYTRDAFRAIRPAWAALGRTNETDPILSNMTASGLTMLQSYRDELRSARPPIEESLVRWQSLLASGGTIVNSTGTLAEFSQESSAIDLSPFTPYILPGSDADSRAACGKRLAALDPSLGKTYDAIWETLYGTRADPERAALYLIRQSFDHLLEFLAPDDEEVRRSPFWKKKGGDQPQQIDRRERFRFAVDKQIEDAASARRLLASTDNMLDTYKALNAAHKRGRLDQRKARRALEQMRTFLEDWVNALRA